MKCPKGHGMMRKVWVSAYGATQKALSFQCSHCDYYEFDQRSAQRVVEELSESPLKIKQKIVKLSQDRLGIYFNTHVVRSLDLKKGENVYISVPDKKHIILEVGE